MRSSGVPPLEPAGICDACGAAGTVGRVFRRDANDAPVDIHRCCLTCWTPESERVTAQWEHEHAARFRAVDYQEGSAESIHRESATWDNAVFLVTGIEAALQNEDPQHESISLDSLAQFADELATSAPEMAGPTPDIVAQFIQQYRANAV